VEAGTGDVIGLAAQDVFQRKAAPRGETKAQRAKRPKESDVWWRVIGRVGRPPEGASYVHVCDRGADIADLVRKIAALGCGYVIRVAQETRAVVDASGRRASVKEVLAGRPVLARYEVAVQAAKGRKARVALMEVRAASVTVPGRKKSEAPVTHRAVEAREAGAPAGVTPLRWVLWASPDGDAAAEPAAEEALRAVAYYEKRWLVEEFHGVLQDRRAQDRLRGRGTAVPDGRAAGGGHGGHQRAGGAAGADEDAGAGGAGRAGRGGRAGRVAGDAAGAAAGPDDRDGAGLLPPPGGPGRVPDAEGGRRAGVADDLARGA
jgi:hypothetical protein